MVIGSTRAGSLGAGAGVRGCCGAVLSFQMDICVTYFAGVGRVEASAKTARRQ